MAADAGPGGTSSAARRPGRRALTAFGVLLLVGGLAAVAFGLAGQDDGPPAPTNATTQQPGPAEGGGIPAPSPSAAAPAPSTAPANPAPLAALPVSVAIPAIDVQSDLITVGLNPDGTLEVPQPGPDYDKAAWYDGSPRPGEIGPSVIEGHVDSAANGPSVFYDLGRLSVGDEVSVTREDGTVVTFAVDEVRSVPKDGFPTLDVYGNTDGAELRLITCGGPFDSTAGHYRDNTVVFASLVGDG